LIRQRVVSEPDGKNILGAVVGANQPILIGSAIVLAIHQKSARVSLLLQLVGKRADFCVLKN